jgi:hypothetical protein
MKALGIDEDIAVQGDYQKNTHYRKQKIKHRWKKTNTIGFDEMNPKFEKHCRQCRQKTDLNGQQYHERAVANELFSPAHQFQIHALHSSHALKLDIPTRPSRKNSA